MSVNQIYYIMKKTIRLIYKRDVDPVLSNLNKILAFVHASGILKDIEPTALVFEGSSHPFVSMGYYQDIDREVDIENAKNYNVIITRRYKLGLGNIFVDKNVAIFGMITPTDWFSSINEAYDVLVGKILLRAVKRLGVIDAVYVPPNDIRIKGKKLCGTGIAIIGDKMVFDAVTNLRKPDPILPFKVLKVPPEKLADKGVKSLEEYFASIETDGIKGYSEGELKSAIAEALSAELNADVYEGELTREENKVWEEYSRIVNIEDFIYRRSTNKFIGNMPKGCKYGFAQIKYRKLVQASVAVNDEGKIVDLMITGDFGLNPPDLDEEISNALKGLSINDFEEAVRRVKSILAKPGYVIVGATPEEFIKPVFEAARNALSK